jgi:hypothetical protein
MRGFLFALACTGMLVLAFTENWVHVDYTVPHEGLSVSKNVLDSEVVVGKDGKLKLFDKESEYLYFKRI